MSKTTYFFSGVGTLKYPWINTPDTKFNDLGEYHTKHIVDAVVHAKMIEDLQPVLDEFIVADKESAKRAKWSRELPFEEELDDSGNETGNYVWSFKQAARIVKDGKDDLVFKVELVDADTNPMNQQVGGGSEAKIKYSARPYGMPAIKRYGLSLKPAAVQILKLVEGGSSVASGFSKEDGFVSEETAEEFEPVATAVSGDFD